MEKKTFYITTPIYYPSDKLHIGHAYTTVAADAISRYKRMNGYDTFFLTGTDEHGQKIERKAAERGVTPQQYVDEIVSWIKNLWEEMKISYDGFIRTTEPRHHKVVQHVFQTIYEKGDIYSSEYEGWYCTPCETFWTERQLSEGGCCPDCGRPTEKMKEESYFFKMSKYADAWLQFIEENPSFIQPESRRNEMINFVKSGLEDLCISRSSLKWGIPVPINENHVIYVWFDALSNYLTGIQYLEDDAFFNRYWPADLHLVGKEIMRFHTIQWPIMLMSMGLPLPKQVFGHGWLVMKDGKMSKSKGNVVDPLILKKEFGLDAIRYYLLREMAFGSDGAYSTESLISRINSDLANDLGNLLNRTIAMVQKYFHGVIPTAGVPTEFDADLMSVAQKAIQRMEESMDELQMNVALEELWNLIRRANKYIDETRPWVLAKDETQKETLGTVLYNLCEVLRVVAVALKPFLVETAVKMGEQLGVVAEIEAAQWSETRWGLLSAGKTVKVAEPIFPRIDMEEYFKSKGMLAAGDAGASAKAESSKPAKAAKTPKTDTEGKQEQKKTTTEGEEKGFITFDEFQKLDLRVAQVLHAEAVEGSSKLLKVQVEIGEERRQLVAGIAKHYKPEELIGKKVVMVYNMKPAKIFGIESNGMILAASTGDDSLLAVTALDRDLPTGSRVK